MRLFSGLPGVLRTRRAAECYFRTDGSTAGLGKGSAMGGMVSVATQGLKLCAQIASLAILARLLAPRDFGYIAMGGVVVRMLQMFSGQALAYGVIQRRDLASDQLSGFFWVSVGLCLLLAAAAAATGPLLSRFFGVPPLTAIVPVLALEIVLAGVAATHLALLARAMQFVAISGIDLVASFVSKLAGVLAALCGAGYWSLAVVLLSYEALRGIMAWHLCRWRPRPAQFPRSTLSLLRFGASLSVRSVIQAVAQEADRILIGRAWSSNSLGLYAKSQDVAGLPDRLINWPLERVAVSALSKLQDDAQRSGRFFCAITEYYLCLVTPLFLFLSLAAPHLVALLLGGQWTDAAPILRFVSLAFLLRGLGLPLEWFLVANNRLRLFMLLTVAENLARIAANVCGLRWGPVGVAIALAAAHGAFLPVTIGLGLRGSLSSVARYLGALWRPAVATAAAAAFFGALEPRLGLAALPAWAAAAAGAGMVGGAYALALLALPGGRRLVTRAAATAGSLLADARARV